MKTYVAFLRGINVGGNKMLKMSALKALIESLGFRDVQTYLQSGNVVFRCRSVTAKRIEDEIQKTAGMDVRVILRTADELRSVVAANPFPSDRDPARLIVHFLDREMTADAVAKLRQATVGMAEEIHAAGRELYVYYPDGMGQSKLGAALTEKKLGAVPTARNWNTVTALMGMM